MANWFSARIFLAGFILLLATLLVALVVGNIRRDRTETVLDIVRPEADLAMQKINYTETRDGLRKWSVQADSATHDFKGNSAAIRNVRMILYDKKHGDILIRAHDGVFDLAERSVSLKGKISLENVGGYTIFAEELKFEDDKHLLSSDKSVKVVADGMNFSGLGLRYDLERNSLRLLSSVEASFKGALALP